MFAKQAGAVPQDATKKTHGRERELFKACSLGVLFGMQEGGLAARIGQSPAAARELLLMHRQTYRRFWRWSDAAVDFAATFGELQTVFGWTIHCAGVPNPRFIRNFPMQGNGAEMLRLACCYAVEAGIEVCAPVHDALLVEADEDELDSVVARTQASMARASRDVLDGFELRSDAKLVRHPGRYDDERGRDMWNLLMNILAEIDQKSYALGNDRDEAAEGEVADAVV